MPIKVTCDDCSLAHRVKDDAVGKRFKCKGCGKSLKVEMVSAPENVFDQFKKAGMNDEFDASDAADDGEVDSRKSAKRSDLAGRKSSKSKSGTPKPVPLQKTKVSLGIDCVYFGFLLTVAVMFGAFALD